MGAPEMKRKKKNKVPSKNKVKKNKIKYQN